MNLTRRRMLQLAASGVLVSRFETPAWAQGFPAKPVTLICPWPPGGSTDVAMRALAEATGKHLGQPVVIDNKPGGSGTVGPAAMVATAKPDGYTLSQIPITIFRFPHMLKTTWDPLKDFTYVIHATGYVFGTIVKADSPWKTWQEFIAHAKANSGKVTYATGGAGTSPHITMEQIALKEGFKWTHVPMKGGAEVTTAVLGGHVAAGADSTSWAPQVDAGQLRLLVTWGAQRTKRWPEVPTLKELGHGIVSSSPYGYAGPKGMDPKVVKILHDAFKKGMEEPAYLKTLDRLDMEPFYKNSEDYAKFAKEQTEELKVIVEQLGLARKS
jgi:tripartite-type tricarboxylate transporter receptor subunit TctC